jgi:hypothetical protein
MSLSNLYKKSLKNIIIEEPVNLLFYRPVGFILAKLLIHTPVTPNGVTILSMLFGITAGMFYSAGRAVPTLIAGILFLTANLLDCTDGQLARLKGVSSKLGRILDGLSDYVTNITIFICIAIGYSGKFYTLPVWWGLVLLAGISNILQSFLTDIYRSRFITWTTGRSLSLTDEYKELEENKPTSKKFDRFISRLYCMYLSLNTKISPSESRSRKNMDHELLIRRNKRLVRAWSWIGPSTRVSIAVAASLLNRPDLYFLAIVIPLNLFALVLYILQAKLDSKEKE